MTHNTKAEFSKLFQSNYKKCNISWNVYEYINGEDISSESLLLEDNAELNLCFSYDHEKPEYEVIPIMFNFTGFKQVHLFLFDMALKLPGEKLPVYRSEPCELYFDTCDNYLSTLPYNFCSVRTIFLEYQRDTNHHIGKITQFKINCTFFIECNLVVGSLLCDMHQLFTSATLSDVKIVCKGKEFKVHKSVLAARSPVFSRMLTADNLETKTDTITIEDSDPDTLEVFLSHLYSENQQLGLEEHTEGVLYLASKYLVQGMQEECFHLLRQRLTPVRVLSYFTQAHFYNWDFKHPTVVKYVRKNIKEIVNTDEWEQLKNVQPIIAVKMLEFLIV